MIKLNGVEIDFGFYPNGELRIGKTAQGALDSAVEKFKRNVNVIRWIYEDDTDLMKLAVVNDYLHHHSEAAIKHLEIPYMPYSRMDRVTGTMPFTLRIVCDFINDMDFEYVKVWEPHSDVCMALLNNVEAFYPTIDLLPEVMKQMGFDKERDFLMFPDAGAQKRYASLTGFKSIVGFKHRDFKTGALTGEMQIVLPPGTMHTHERRVLILDDLCSRGGTFAMAVKALRSYGMGGVSLFTTHCEMSHRQTLDGLLDGYYFTDSMLGYVPDAVMFRRYEHMYSLDTSEWTHGGMPNDVLQHDHPYNPNNSCHICKGITEILKGDIKRREVI